MNTSKLFSKIRLQNKWIPFILLSIAISCQTNNEPAFQGPQVAQFNLDLFEQNLIDYVNWDNDAPVGWTYAITKDGQLVRSGAFGNAIQEPDGTIQAMTVNKELNIASITKFYTAIAVMQLLEELNLTIHSLIDPFFPPSWTIGPYMDDMTFAHLLRHESGLDTGNTDFDNTLSYAAIKQSVQDGVGVPPPDQSDYDNINFAIFRILIPAMQNQVPNAPITDLSSDADTQLAYKNYMQTNIFNVAGLANVDFTEESPSPARYYNVDDPANNISGTTYGDWDHISGGGGYFMTIIEMAAVNAYFEHTDNLITENSKNIIKENYLGLDSYFDGDSRELHGKYYGKMVALELAAT